MSYLKLGPVMCSFIHESWHKKLNIETGVVVGANRRARNGRLDEDVETIQLNLCFPTNVQSISPNQTRPHEGFDRQLDQVQEKPRSSAPETTVDCQTHVRKPSIFHGFVAECRPLKLDPEYGYGPINVDQQLTRICPYSDFIDDLTEQRVRVLRAPPNHWSLEHI